MERVSSFVERFVHEEDGASASEYAVLVAVIVVAVFLAVKAFNLSDIFTTVSNKVKGCVNATGNTC